MLEKLRQTWKSREFKTFALYGLLALTFIWVVIFAISPVAVSIMRQWSRSDVEMRSKLIFSLTERNFVQLLGEKRTSDIDSLFERIAEDEKVVAVGFCDAGGSWRYATRLMPASITSAEVARSDTDSYASFRANRRDVLVAAFPVANTGGHFVVLNDLSFAQQRGAEVRRYFAAILAILILGLAIAATTLVFLYIRGWVVRVRRTLLDGRHAEGDAPQYGPFEQEIRLLLHQLEYGRKGFEEDHIEWDASVLRRLVEDELSGTEVLVVSNREPYIHNYGKNGIEIQLPASGLVSALEPVMRACGGTWIAHGSGSADRDVVDQGDKIAVPPGHASHACRSI